MSEPGLNVITSAITGLLSAVSTSPFGSVDLPSADVSSVLGTGEAAWTVRVKQVGASDLSFSSDHPSGMDLENYPRDFLNAVLAAEDSRFRQHAGADPIGTLSAAADTMMGKMRGGSSLTQQLVKNAVVGNAPTSDRKIAELILAVRLEAGSSKSAIMESYLRHAWFGRGAHGAAHAARVWFGKSWDDLSLAENVTLAAMLKGPGRYDPENNPSLVKGRRNNILSRMEGYGWVSADEAEAARSEEVVVIPRPETPKGDHWVISALRRGATDLAEKYAVKGREPRERLLTSTIDPEWQKIALSAVSSANLIPDAEAAVVVISLPDGALLASVGGRDPSRSGYDRTGAARQPGSLSKPLFYAAALDMGLTPWSLVRNDGIDSGGGWDPKNYDGKQTGPAPLYQGLEASSNLMTLHLADSVPMDSMFRIAEMSGAWEPGEIRPYGPSLLGATETNLRRITSGLAGLMAGGQTVPIRTFVEDRPVPRQFISRASAESVLAMMRGVMTRGTSSVAGKSAKVAMAGKTGTSQNYRDAWFVGLTPHVAVGVWVGRDDDKSMGSGHTGGVVSSRIAISVLNQALKEGMVDERGFVPGRGTVDHEDWPPELIRPSAGPEQGVMTYVAGQDEGWGYDTVDGLPPVFGSGEAQVDAFLDQIRDW